MKNEKFKIEYKDFIPKGLSIVIPFHGKYEYVTSLVESIFRYARGFDIEIILIDDNSPNRNYLETYKDVGFVTRLRMDEHKGFGASINAGLKIAKYETFMGIHSDCKIESNIFFTLFTLLDKFSMVSPKTNNPVCGFSLQLGDKRTTDDALVVEDYLSLYAFMIKTNLFKSIGGLKEYKYAFCENKELAYRMYTMGLKQGVSGATYIYHHGNKTVVDVARKSQEVRITMENNEKLYLEDLSKLINKNK